MRRMVVLAVSIVTLLWLMVAWSRWDQPMWKSGAVAQSGPDEGDNRHPSGKDRSEEHGKSGTQGKSETDPDGDTKMHLGSDVQEINRTT